MPTSPMPLRLLPWMAGASVLLLCSAASGYEAVVTATTDAQGYEMRSPWGEPILARRRFMQTLGLQVYNFGRADGADAYRLDHNSLDITFHMRLRVDTDFGTKPSEVHQDSGGATFVPGLDGGGVDVMYAYADIKGIAQGMADARIGRQYIVDPLGWWSMDGAKLSLRLPIHVGVEGYAGVEQRGGLPLSTPRFEAEGVWRGDRTGWEERLYPSMLSAALAPAWGVSVQSLDLPVVHVAASYRKVWNTGQVTSDLLPTEPGRALDHVGGTRVSSERVAASSDIVVSDVGAVRGGLVYDVGQSVFSSVYGSADMLALSWLTLGADADRVVPTFDYESIWSAFGPLSMTTVTGRAGATVTHDIDVSISGGGRMVADSMDAWDTVARVGARWRAARALFGVSGMTDGGARGRRLGTDMYGRLPLSRWLSCRAHLSLYDWRDEQRPDRSALSMGYVLGGQLRIQRYTSLLMAWEHNMNRLVGNQYRVLASLQVTVTK